MLFIKKKKGCELQNNIETPYDKAAKKAAKSCHVDEKVLVKQMHQLDFEYGLPLESYVKEKYYKYSFDEQCKIADRNRAFERNLEKAARQTGKSASEIRTDCLAKRKKEKIETEIYFEQKLYLNDEERELIQADRKKTQRLENKWLKKGCEKSGADYDDLAAHYNRVSTLFGVTAKEYVNTNMYEMTDLQISRRHKLNVTRQERRKFMLYVIKQATGKDEKQVMNELRLCREAAPEISVSVKWYFTYNVFRCSFDVDESAQDNYKKTVYEIIKLKNLSDIILEKLRMIDAGELTYSDVMEDVEKYYILTRKLISPERIDFLCNMLRYSIPEITEDNDLRERIATDMEVTYSLLKFQLGEYVSFSFYKKSFEEKRKYISSIQKERVFKLINNPEIKELLCDKYLTYEKFSRYYSRDAILINDSSQFDQFADFVARHPVFVKKDIYGAMGKGVEKLSLDGKNAIKNTFEDILEEDHQVILEELIVPHEVIRKLNPDSVNTVRITVFVENSIAKVQDCFMKIGRAGSFVDNGGAGGILVHINRETGELDSFGLDENGVIYEKHPDHNYDFKGCMLPKWDDAISVATEISAMVDEKCYVGWDLTLNSNGEWVIVEGNSNTQFYGQQGTTNCGLKEKFLSAVGLTAADIV